MKRKKRAVALERTPLTFVVTSWTLQEVYQRVVHDINEDITLLTGERVGNLRMLSRICPVRARNRSIAHASVSAQDLIAAAVPIIEHGLWIHAYAHSHPGCGPEATWPSGIDCRDLGDAQRRGSQAVGMIFSRDACCRFFSPRLPIRVLVLGSGVTQLSEYVFHLQVPSPVHDEAAESTERLLAH
jgi:hypothetical protein